MNVIQSSNNDQAKQIEVGANPEQKEQFDKNSQEFKEKYEQKLKSILPENLVGKISGSFELSGDLNSQIENLKNDGLSDESINFIKNFLNENISIPNEKVNQINKELENFSNEKNLDMRLGDLIGKATRKAEETENDELFDKIIEARKIQQNGETNQKAKVLSELENFLKTGEEKKEVKTKNNFQTLADVGVESEDVGNDRSIFEGGGFITGDLFFKDKEPESNDYGNTIVENKENLLQKGINAFKGEKNEEQKVQENYSETNGEYFPILENLLNSNEISKEKFDSINKELSGKSNQEKEGYFRNFIEKLPNSENKTNILQNFNENKEKITEENFEKSKFSLETKGKIDFDKSIGGVEIMLAENYISITNKEIGQEKNIEQNINNSMEISKNKIIKSKSVDFKSNNAELISEISNEKNLNVKYQKLKQLYKEGLKEDAKSGGKKGKEEMERKKEDLIGQYKETLEKIKEAEKTGNKEDLEKFNKQKLKIENEAKDTQDLIEELDKITKETDLDVGTQLSEKNETKKE